MRLCDELPLLSPLEERLLHELFEHERIWGRPPSTRDLSETCRAPMEATQAAVSRLNILGHIEWTSPWGGYRARPGIAVVGEVGMGGVVKWR